MTHDPRHSTTICEHCGRADPDLKHRRSVDEYWCDNCWDAGRANGENEEVEMTASGDATKGLLPCPFCAEQMMFRKALWPTDGCVDAIIHAAPGNCPMTDFFDGTINESIIARWNTRVLTAADKTRIEALTEALEKLATIKGSPDKIQCLFTIDNARHIALDALAVKPKGGDA